MRSLGALAIGALAACSSSGGDSTIDLTHDACAPLALVSAMPSALQLEAIDAAQALWRDRGAPAIGLRAGATIDVRFQTAAAAFYGLYDDEHGIIYINDAIASRSVLSIVLAHELGHAFGLPHVEKDERISLMNPGNTTTPPTEEDQRALIALWGSCTD